MKDSATIEAAFKNATIEEIETVAEAAARAKKPAVIVTLTPPIIGAVVDWIKEGKSLREIKATPVQIGPQGQKWKLSNAQIRAIEAGRKARYAELLSELNDPID